MSFWRTLFKWKCLRLALFSHIQADVPCSTHFHHFGLGTVIGKGVRLGRDCHVYQGVTLGSKKKGVGGSPVVGDNCIFYANSVVVGDIVLGDNVVVGANVFLDKCLGDGTVYTSYNKNNCVKEK